jgi:ubiquinone/menaquinone biosynthesis C-methylase UbiE
MKDVKFWNKIAEGYDKSSYSTYADAYKRTIEKTKKYLNPEMTVLDIGCGTGIITNEIAEDVKKIDAIDYSEKMIKEAETKAAKKEIKNITYAVKSVNELNGNGIKYNCITAFNVLYFIKNIDEMLDNIHCVLEKDGLFISVTDCFGEKTTLKTILTKVLQKTGIVPFMKYYSIKELREKITEKGFEIIGEESLYNNLPNYFIAARKMK